MLTLILSTVTLRPRLTNFRGMMFKKTTRPTHIQSMGVIGIEVSDLVVVKSPLLDTLPTLLLTTWSWVVLRQPLVLVMQVRHIVG